MTKRSLSLERHGLSSAKTEEVDTTERDDLPGVEPGGFGTTKRDNPNGVETDEVTTLARDSLLKTLKGRSPALRGW